MNAHKPEPNATVPGALWGGRFRSGPSAELQKLSKSTQFDWALAKYDLLGSMAHARALAKAGYLDSSELTQMLQALERLLQEVETNALKPTDSDEDVHGALERELIEALGPELGGKLRAGRSRNDQVATLIRLYLLDHSGVISGLVVELIRAILRQAKDHPSAVMAGRTHLQHAQPVLLSHHLLAHAWPLVRDLERFQDWAKRASESPYGAGALAGSGLGLDSTQIAIDLGLTKPMPNSIDATSSRDVVSEFCFITAQIGIDVSRFAEEIIIWNTQEFGYIELDDRYSTGSSIMPQKKNPDVAELARGKAGRLVGNLSGLLASLKSLPLSYNRDLQEDKEPVFDSVETLEVLLPAFTGTIATAKFNTQRMANLATEGFTLATEVADWLVKRSVPFRYAHEIVGSLVSFCESNGIALEQLSEAQLNTVSPLLTKDVLGVLSIEGSISAKNSIGGTAPERVAEQIQLLEERIEALAAK